jgi:hypothetical protein
MLLEKPQSEAVEQIMTDIYNAGQDSILKALNYFHEQHPRKGISSFLEWYSNNSEYFTMQFKVSDK